MWHIAGSTLSATAGAMSVLLIESALKSILILAAAAALACLLRNSTAQVRRTLWGSAVVAALLIPVLTLAVPSWRLSLLPVAVDARGGMDRLIGAIPLAGSPEARPIDQAPAAPTQAELPPPTSFAGLLVIAWWSLGTMLVTAWWTCGLIQVRRIAARATAVDDFDTLLCLNRLRVKLGIRRRVSLGTHEDIRGPVTFGVLRPVILLPGCAAGWTAERRRMVLMHELVHVRRGDWLIQMVGQAVCALYWFNPLAWVAAQRFAIERELACDDDVLRLGARPSDYAMHLLDIARSMTHWSIDQVAAMAQATRSKLEVRLASILADRDRLARRRVVLATVACVILMAAGLSSLRPWREARASQSQSRFAAARVMLMDGRWTDAVLCFQEVVDREPENGFAWLNLALAHNARGDVDAAIEASEKAAEFPEVRAASLYESARARAQGGQVEAAFAALAAAREAGYYAEPETLINDPHLAPLHDDPRMTTLAATLVPPDVQFEQCHTRRDREGLVALWKTYPQRAVALLRESLEAGVATGEHVSESAALAERAASPVDAARDRAAFIAETLSEAFDRPEFGLFAGTALAWDETARDERAVLVQLLRDELNSVDASGTRALVRRVRALGDPYLLITALLRTGGVLEGLDDVAALVEALSAYREAAGLARTFGAVAEEADALRGQARVLTRLGRDGEAVHVLHKLRELISLLPARFPRDGAPGPRVIAPPPTDLRMPAGARY